VTLVTPLVNVETLPKTPDAKCCTLPTTEAAKADPGRLGKGVDLPPPNEAAGIEVEVDIVLGRATDGSYRHHQIGVGIKTGPLKVCWVRSAYLLSSIVQSMTSS
jgi:hypothetical protein